MGKIIIAIILLFIDFQGFTDYTFVRILPLLFFAYIIFDLLLKFDFRFKLPSKQFNLFFLLAIMVVVGVLRSQGGVVSIQLKLFKVLNFTSFFIAFFMIVFEESKKKNLFKTCLKFAYYPLLIFVTINFIILLLSPINNLQSVGVALMFSKLGIIINRVSFPLTIGINAYGSFLGILLTFSLIGFFVIKIKKKLFLFGILISLVSILLTDSRGPLVYSIFVLLLIKLYYFKTKKPKFLWVIPLLGFFGPLIILSILAFLATTSFADSISRTSGDLATGNSRAIIWAIAFSDFLKYNPINHFFGYGEWGQFTSGVSPQYAFIFGNLEGAEYMHPHNTFLSIALDYGYLGLTIYTIFQYAVINEIKRNWNKYKFISTILLGNIIYFNLVGIGETMFGFYYQNVLYVFFMINIFAFILKYQLSVNNKKIEI